MASRFTLMVAGQWMPEQTRPHNDLDIALPHKYVPMLRDLLSSRGYHEEPATGTWECNFATAARSMYL
jgi:hypothetical protein